MNLGLCLIGVRLLLIGAVAYSVGVPAMAAASDWPQFRGPDAGVAADNPKLPSTWDSTKNVVWTTEVPGIGWNSPIVSGDHVRDQAGRRRRHFAGAWHDDQRLRRMVAPDHRVAPSAGQELRSLFGAPFARVVVSRMTGVGTSRRGRGRICHSPA